MKVTKARVSAGLLAFSVAGGIAWKADAGRELVKFPESYTDGVHYTTVKRGNIREEIFTTRLAVEAVTNGQSMPNGTVITMGRIIGTENCSDTSSWKKRAGWGAEYPPDLRNGEWEFQAFNADGTVNEKENVTRCFSCHKSQSAQDFVFTLGQMKTAK